MRGQTCGIRIQTGLKWAWHLGFGNRLDGLSFVLGGGSRGRQLELTFGPCKMYHVCQCLCATLPLSGVHVERLDLKMFFVFCYWSILSKNYGLVVQQVSRGGRVLEEFGLTWGPGVAPGVFFPLVHLLCKLPASPATLRAYPLAFVPKTICCCSLLNTLMLRYVKVDVQLLLIFFFWSGAQ